MKTVEALATSHSVRISRRSGREGGMALVLVLGVLAASLLMVMHLMVVSEVIEEAKVAVLRSELRYQAESAADIGF